MENIIINCQFPEGYIIIKEIVTCKCGSIYVMHNSVFNYTMLCGNNYSKMLVKLNKAIAEIRKYKVK